MTESVELETIRDFIRQENKPFSTALDYLWQASRELHDSQNKADGTENGRRHVEMVERNIWRLIRGTDKVNAFNITERFVLSAAACCHDLDKALPKSTGPSKSLPHGAGSAAFLRQHFRALGLLEHEHLADDVSKIIEMHHMKGNRFIEEVRKLKRKGRATPTEAIRHRLLAVLLKTADILHTDNSRTRKLGINLEGFTPLQRSKYVARTCIRGWDLDGSRIIIQARIETEEQKRAIQACREFMLNREWPTVAQFLEAEDFPYILEFDIEQNVNTGGRIMSPSDEKPERADIPLQKKKRFLKRATTDLMLKTAVKRIERYPICRSAATTHAAGSAVASLSVLIMLDEIAYFMDEFVTKSHEFIIETEYIPKKLSEHITSLSELISLLSSRVIDEGPPSAGEHNGHFLKRTFQSLPDTEGLYAEFRRIHDAIVQHINEMNHLYQRIAKEIQSSKPSAEEMAKDLESDKWSGDIRNLFEAKRPALLGLRKEVEAVWAVADGIRESINVDWDGDINHIWDVEENAHRPKKRRKTTPERL